MDKPNTGTLFRYTNLASVLHSLRTRTLTLLTPTLWEDENDRYFMEQYQLQSGWGSVLALCFTTASESFHHWKVFAAGQDGVRIHLSADAVRDAVREQNADFRKVCYRQIRELRNKQLTTEELPFVKRWPYRDEEEFRLVVRCRESLVASKSFDISPTAIQKVVLSPWLHESLHDTVRATIKSVKDCSGIPVHGTTLLKNSEWMSLADKARPRSD